MIHRPSLLAFSSLGLSATAAILAVLSCGPAQETQAAVKTEHAASTPKKDAVPSSAGSTQTGTSNTPTELVDAPLASYRTELLALAFDAASALPTDPHKKNRCRMQEDVVTTCLQLDQPRRALSYIEKIDNWRRGSTYADLAYYVSRHGGGEQVNHFLELADEIADRHKTDTKEQEWRPELIKAKIAGILVAAHPEKTTADFAARVAELDALVDHGGLEETMRALVEFARLYDEQYADEARRNMLYSKVRNSWSKSPYQIRFETVLKLAESALAHEDPQTAAVLAGEARILLTSVGFAPEDSFPLVARLVDVMRRAGDATGARSELAAAEALYDKHEETISSTARSQALRPLAEQYKKLDDTQKALQIYSRAIEAGVVNPNSRPRADDLQAVCCSLARCDLDPGEKLMKRLREIRAGLREPW